MSRAAILLLLLAAAAAAQDLTPRAPPQDGPIAIVHGTVHPVSGPAIDDGFVLFDKGLIVEVGRGTPPGSPRLVDAGGKHVYPGWIASFTNLGLTEIGAVRATQDDREVGDVTPEVRAAVAVNPDSTLFPVARANGVLAFACFPGGGLVPGRASVLSVEGWTWEDMAVETDAGLVVDWPAPRPPPIQGDEKDAGKAMEEVRKNRERLEQAFLGARAYAAARAADPATAEDVRYEAMRGAIEGRSPVFLLADDYDQIAGALAFASRWKLKPVIVGGRDAWLLADEIRAADASVIVDGVHRFPKRSDSDYDEAFKLPARLEAAGISWCLASGEGASNERNLPYAAGRAVAYGLPRDAAIRAITLYAARILGVDARLGSLEKGKDATLLVVDGDPLEIPTNVALAYVGGRAIDLTSKQRKLYEKYRAKYAR
ncbi:MAG TPA: amidohydrolase family protein [Planctomycetota bacterium]|nr:amidohydrolase family protein [Planctomycetota bacterium]